MEVKLTPEFVARIDQIKAARRDALSDVRELSRFLFTDLTPDERITELKSRPPMECFALMILAEDAGETELLNLLLECGDD
jgi:hypothetical protein